MSERLDRRDVLAITSAATVATIVGIPVSTQAATETKAMSYTPKPIPFDANSIKGLSSKLLTSHYENNYAGAVKRLNAIVEEWIRKNHGILLP